VNEIAQAFLAACQDEIEAPKPGNVHIYADGHGMTARDFMRSAEAAVAGLCTAGAPVGQRILAAIEATLAAVGQNTNLGIVLLCAPLAAAAEAEGDLRIELSKVLAALSRADAAAAFHAIILANPAGLGEAPRHDVRTEADTTLLQAMKEAADRDRIAFQYAFGFCDIFETGFAALAALRERKLAPPWPAVGVHLAFLAGFADSHILRKKGPTEAAFVQSEARLLHRSFIETPDPTRLLPELLGFDRKLKMRGTNPGTTADLTVATLFADRLTAGLIERRNDG
jgi:triphosphoribosyl-dephospho-CoA synthase